MDDMLDDAALKKLKIEDRQQKPAVQCTEHPQDSFYESKSNADKKYSKSNSNDDEYNFSHSKRGVAVVIINHEVLGEGKRTGSELDMKHFQSMFSSLGFSIRTFQDKTAEELLNQLLKIAKEDHAGCDCFALAVSTHGAETFNSKGLHKSEKGRLRDDLIYTKDKAIKTRLLLDMFSDKRCPSLKGKPRFFFVQACRGGAFDDGVEVKVPRGNSQPTSGGRDVTDSNPCVSQPEQGGNVLDESRTVGDGIPSSVQIRAQALPVTKPPLTNRTSQQTKAMTTLTAGEISQASQSLHIVDVCPAPCYKDYLVMYATPPGNYAFRRTSEGSWFVKGLMEVMSKSEGKRSLSQELTQVIGKVCEEQSRGKNPDKKQSPVIYSMLTKDVFFRPKP